MEYLQYFYVVLWLALGVLCVFIGKRLGAVGYMLAGFFGFLAVWYGLRSFAGLPVFDGVLGIVYRVVLLVFLGLTVWVWYRGRKAAAQKDKKALPHDDDCHCDTCEEEHGAQEEG